MNSSHKGEIATLLTLGLVLVGAVITLASSFFVNRSKIASNPRATTINCVYSNSTECNSAKKNEDCGSNSISCTKCTNGLYRCQGTDDSPTAPTAPAGATAVPTIGGSGGVGDMGKYRTSDPGFDPGACGITGTNYKDKQVFNCCAKNGNWTGCYESPCNGVNINQYQPCSDVVASTPATTGGGSQGGTIVGQGQSCCFQKKGTIYVYATYNSMIANDMLDKNGNPDCKRQENAINSSYGPIDIPPGAFVCAGGASTGMSVDDYHLAYDAPPTSIPNPTEASVRSKPFPNGQCVSVSTYDRCKEYGDALWYPSIKKCCPLGKNPYITPNPTQAIQTTTIPGAGTTEPTITKTPTPTPTIDISNVDYKSLGNLTVILNLGNNSYVKTGDRFILNIPEYAPMVQTEGSISNFTVTFSVNNMARYTSGFGGGTNQKSYTLNIIYNGNSIVSEKITFGPTEINKTVSYNYNLGNLHPSIDFVITNNSCEAGFVITKNSLYISGAGAFNFPSENITVNQGKTVTETFNLPSDQSLLINNNTASIQAFCNTNSGSKSLRLNNLPITEDANGNFKIYISD